MKDEAVEPKPQAESIQTIDVKPVSLLIFRTSQPMPVPNLEAIARAVHAMAGDKVVVINIGLTEDIEAMDESRLNDLGLVFAAAAAAKG